MKTLLKGQVAAVNVKPSAKLPEIVEAHVKIVCNRDRDAGFDELVAMMGSEVEVTICQV